MPKVLVLPSWYPGPFSEIAGSFFREQSRGLLNAGADVRVIAVNPFSLKSVARYCKFPISRRVFDDDRIYTVQLDIPNIPRVRALNLFVRVFLGIREAKTLFRSWRPDIVLAHSFRAGMIANKIKKRFGIPFIVIEHSSEFLECMKKRTIKLAGTVFQSADLCCAVSPRFVQALEKMYALPFHVVPNFVNTDFFSPLQNQKNAVFTFIQVGAFVPVKRTPALIASFAQAMRLVGRPMRLRLIGDGADRCASEEVIRTFGIASDVEIVGMLSRAAVRDAIASSDCLVVSSEIETFGVSVIEALACGLPVISTRCGGPEWVLDGAPDCRLVDDPGASLVQAMAEAADKKVIPDRSAIRTFAVERFSETVIAKKLLSMLNEIIDK